MNTSMNSVAMLPCLSLAAAMALACAAPARAQDAPACTPEHAAMGHCKLQDAHGHAPASEAAPGPAPTCTPEHAAMGHCRLQDAHDHAPAPEAPPATATCPPEHAAMGHCTPATTPARAGCSPEHAAMGHCTPGPAGAQTPREPIPPVTEADRAAAFPALRHAGMSHASSVYGRVLFNRLEAWDADPGSGQAWEGSASVGGDLHRLWLRSEGEREGGRTGSAEVELLYGRGITPWWDVVAGVRHDFRPGPSQTRAAFGVQGLAPYFFEISATAYLGGSGRLAAAVEAEYELLLTHRLILQPLLELEFNGEDDPRRRVGSGLSKAEAGLRLRYEITRRFAPYVGLAHERVFGGTAGYRLAEGEPVRDTKLVAGVRLWF